MARTVSTPGTGPVSAGRQGQVVGLVAMIGAAINGASFVGKPGNSDSLVMALLSVLALLVYALSLYTLTGRK